MYLVDSGAALQASSISFHVEEYNPEFGISDDNISDPRILYVDKKGTVGYDDEF